MVSLRLPPTYIVPRPNPPTFTEAGRTYLELREHLDPEGVLTTPLLPGFSLPLRKLVE